MKEMPMNPPKSYADIPTAKEMATKSDAIVNAHIGSILDKVSKSLQSASGYSVTISLSQEEERFANNVIVKLKNLGYKVDFKAGHCEVSEHSSQTVIAKLTIDWSC